MNNHGSKIIYPNLRKDDDAVERWLYWSIFSPGAVSSAHFNNVIAGNQCVVSMLMGVKLVPTPECMRKAL